MSGYSDARRLANDLRDLDRADFIREKLKGRELTMKQISAETGMSYDIVRKVLRGDRRFDFDVREVRFGRVSVWRVVA